MIKIPFKRGDTFLVEATARQGATPQDITGWVIASHVRRGTTLVAALEVTIVDAAAGTYRLRKENTGADGTERWPVSDLECDIQYTTAAGQIVSTETFIIDMVKDITLP